MKLKTLFLLLFLMFATSPKVWCDVSAYKGLFIMSFGAKSYKNFFGAIMKSLLVKQHKMTFVGPFNFNFNNENITEITVAQDFYDKYFNNMFNKSVLSDIQFGFEFFPEICTSILEDKNVQEVLKEKYDYIILSVFYTECFWDYLYKTKVPIIYASPNEMVYPLSSNVGAPEFASVYPHKFLPLRYPLTFKERVLSSLGNLFMRALVEGVVSRIEKICLEREHWSADTPPVSDLGKNISLSIINSIRPLEVPVKPVPPNIIYAGGLHIKHSNYSLPKDIEEWLNGSGDFGFILFSLGTAIKLQDMKKETLDIIFKVLGNLEQRIICAWDLEGIENLPSNVMLKPYLPQQDILAHPKIRLYITHGGMLSLQEATYYGVPIVGIPVFADQKGNIDEAVIQGWGKIVGWKDLTEQQFSHAIQEVLTNESISLKAEERSILMRDWPRTPAEEVPYWINYVIRHKGAKHLQSPFVNMSWYEIYNIDVWIFLVVSSTAIVVASYLLLRLTFSFVRRRIFKKRKTD